MFSNSDCLILRELAHRVADIAELPIMAERKALWKRHNALHPVRPMILLFPEGAWCEIISDDTLHCENPHARQIEMELRMRCYGFEHFASDNVVENDFLVPIHVKSSGWGIDAHWHQSTSARGARGFDPVINCAADLQKIHAPELSVDEEKTADSYQQAQELFGDILQVRKSGIAHVSFHLLSMYTSWRGLEEVMIDMYEQPEMLHEAMRILEQGHHQLIQQYIDMNLLELNNNNTYHSSGGVGFTDELPAPGFDPARVRPCDIWSSAESQELAQVSPAQHAEFALPYEKRLLAPFGLNGYGCCEDLTDKLPDIFTIPNIRRISISPWANVDKCAAQMAGNYIFSWKPNPAYMVGNFSVEQTREYVQHTLDAAAEHGCVLEIILKDTHTCDQHPERFDQWTDTVRAMVEEMANKS